MQTTVYFSDGDIRPGCGADMVPALMRGLARLLKPCPLCGHCSCTRHGNTGLAGFPGVLRDVEEWCDLEAGGIPGETPAFLVVPEDDRTLEVMFRVEAGCDGRATVRLCVRETTGAHDEHAMEAIPWG